MDLDRIPFHNNCRQGWGCPLSCDVRQLVIYARELKQENERLQAKPTRKKMDKGTAADMVEDLMLEITQLREQLRQLEAERDQWQTRAVNHD